MILVNVRVRIAVGLALLLVTALAVAPLGRTLTGAKGFKKTYKNRAFFDWRTINLKGRDLPSFDCHVEVLDGEAKMDSPGDGVEKDLSVCMITDGARKIRLGPRDKIVLRDPVEDGALAATALPEGLYVVDTEEVAG